VDSGDLSGRLDLQDQNELSELSRALNAMCDDLAEFQEKVRLETVATLLLSQVGSKNSAEPHQDSALFLRIAVVLN
jgi:methyl-accepting chemotaxis protein